MMPECATYLSLGRSGSIVVVLVSDGQLLETSFQLSSHGCGCLRRGREMADGTVGKRT